MVKKKKNSGFLPYNPLQFTKLIHNILDLTLVSLMSHPVSQRKTWDPVISDSMRVDLVIVSVPLNFHVYVSSVSQVLAAAL